MRDGLHPRFPYSARTVLAVLVLSPLMSVGQKAQTNRQIAHSKLFESYALKGHKLTEGQGEGGFSADAHVPARLTLPQRFDLFTKLACQSDAVILGKVVNQTGLLSPDEDFIFTDAEFVVVETIKDNSANHISANQSIVVTRPGGSLQLNGRKLTVRLNNFEDFSVGGQYLLFLRFLPTTADYEAFWDRTFEVRENLMFNMSKYALWEGQPSSRQDASAVLADARAAAAASCKE